MKKINLGDSLDREFENEMDLVDSLIKQQAGRYTFKLVAFSVYELRVRPIRDSVENFVWKCIENQ